MIYSVTAHYSDEKLKALYQKLMDGSIYSQKPDGLELYFSIKRARITEPGVVKWTEMCFCNTPLKHERETILDKYFDEIETEEVDAYTIFKGTPLIEHLKHLNI
ncbi:MAG: hypothetical protein H0X62_04565 [Bacteroidetes bacterium]|nr:hypothetical protein [Bacteroidota bacterium]